MEAAAEFTPFPIIANVSRVVTKVVDRITGERADFPLLVAAACVEALKAFDIESRIMYGQVAWIEVTEENTPIWAGCWGEHFHFWVATQYGEIVDLNTSVAFRKRSHASPEIKSIYSPPMLWSAEVPAFYRYQPEGIAELELTEEKDQKRFESVLQEVRQKCVPEKLQGESEEFPNEAILCPDKRVLDDSRESFRHFDRVLSVRGIPDAPF